MNTNGFKAAKHKVIRALRDGNFQHEADRKGVDTKNLLLTGMVSASDICAILEKAQGTDHRMSPHHQAPEITVHVIRREGWYVKFYFIDPDTIFISVHK